MRILVAGSVRSSFNRRLIDVLIAHGAEVASAEQTPSYNGIAVNRTWIDEAVPFPVGYSGEKKSKGDKKRARSALNRKGWK